jgi:hypothetical protein
MAERGCGIVESDGYVGGRQERQPPTYRLALLSQRAVGAPPSNTADIQMTDIVMKHENIRAGIAEGDLVRTRKGAHFAGRVDVIFMTKRGNLRAVVEALDDRFAETLHVYPLDQLIPDVP